MTQGKPRQLSRNQATVMHSLMNEGCAPERRAVAYWSLRFPGGLRTIHNMVAEGLVEVERGARHDTLVLTPKGRERFAEHLEAHKRWLKMRGW